MTREGGTIAVPTLVLSQHREGSDAFIKPSDLPSAKFKYDVWHDIKNNTIDADELKNPRIRKGPYPSDRDDENSSSSSSSSDSESDDEESVKKKRKMDRNWLKFRRNHRDEHENWEEAKIVNLSYQNLGDSFQINNFMRVIGMLRTCVELHLVSDELRDLSRISLPMCKVLNLTSNHLTSLKDLPSTKVLQRLNMTENNIKTNDGLEKLKRLKTLHLTRNPISYSFDYRPHIFKKLPTLEALDGTPKLEDDDHFDYPVQKDTCSIC
ncbi:uncharacterized protein LOC120348330 [Styela clava]